MKNGQINLKAFMTLIVKHHGTAFFGPGDRLRIAMSEKDQIAYKIEAMALDLCVKDECFDQEES